MVPIKKFLDNVLKIAEDRRVAFFEYVTYNLYV